MLAIDPEYLISAEEYFKGVSAKKEKFPSYQSKKDFSIYFWKYSEWYVGCAKKNSQFDWSVYRKNSSNSPLARISEVHDKVLKISADSLSTSLFFPDPCRLEIEEIGSSSNGKWYAIFKHDKQFRRLDEFIDQAFTVFTLTIIKNRFSTFKEPLTSYLSGKVVELVDKPSIYYKYKYFLSLVGISVGLPPDSEPQLCDPNWPSIGSPPESLLEGPLLSWCDERTRIAMCWPLDSNFYFVIWEEGQKKSDIPKRINHTYVLTSAGRFIESDGAIDFCCAIHKKFPISVLHYSSKEQSVLLYLDLQNIPIHPSERSVFATFGDRGITLYVDNPFVKDSERYTAIPFPYRYKDNQLVREIVGEYSGERTLITKNFKTNTLNRELNRASKSTPFEYIATLLEIEKGEPLVFAPPYIPSEDERIHGIAKYKELLSRFLERKYCWKTEHGDLVYYENNGQHIWKVQYANGEKCEPTTIEIKDRNNEPVRLPQGAQYITLLDSLRLRSIEGNKIVFENEPYKSCLDEEVLILPEFWRLTFIIDGKTCADLNIQLHARAYLETPASSSPIEIHLTDKGLKAALVPQGAVKERVCKRGQVERVRPSRKLIDKILSDFDQMVMLGDRGTENCSVYVGNIFAYADKPFVKDPLNPLRNSWNPISHATKTPSQGQIVTRFQRQEIMATQKIGDFEFIVSELKNGVNYSYFVDMKTDQGQERIFSETRSGYQREIKLEKKGDYEIILSLFRTGIERYYSWLTITKTFTIKRR